MTDVRSQGSAYAEIQDAFVACSPGRVVERTLQPLEPEAISCFDCQAPPIVGSDGILYGGGALSGGVFYSFDPNGGGYRVIADFGKQAKDESYPPAKHTPNIRYPVSYLVEGADGAFYGVTDETTRRSGGKIYRIDRKGHTQVLHSYPRHQFASSLLLASDGNFYGTTYGDGVKDGGRHGRGTIFRMDPSGVSYTVLYEFPKDYSVETLPVNSQLVQASDGALYGASNQVWRITLDGKFTLIYKFASGNGDGSLARSRLVQGIDGALYGTTENDGPHGLGTVFRVTLDGHETMLHAFDEPGSPVHGLTQDTQGNLYGVTENGGPDSAVGVLYRITPTGQFDVLYGFEPGADGPGIFPDGVTFGPDGNFYGLTTYDAQFNGGSLFELSLK